MNRKLALVWNRSVFHFSALWSWGDVFTFRSAHVAYPTTVWVQTMVYILTLITQMKLLFIGNIIRKRICMHLYIPLCSRFTWKVLIIPTQEDVRRVKWTPLFHTVKHPLNVGHVCSMLLFISYHNSATSRVPVDIQSTARLKISAAKNFHRPAECRKWFHTSKWNTRADYNPITSIDTQYSQFDIKHTFHPYL